MNQSSKADQVKLADSLNREATQRNFVQCAIYLFIPINIAIAALMIIAFTRGVTSRLDVLVDHARKLPKREPILWPVEGDDELAALDLILQKTCEELIECEAHRRAVMQMVAHDMRSPIMAALAGIELVDTMYGEGLPPLGRKQLPKAEQNIGRILHLVNDLLTLDRLEAGRLELDLSTCAVRKLADEAISALSSVAAKRGIALANECEDAFIAADESRLNQVLLNFISNALKFSPDNSAISLVSKHDANFVRIGVRDQGPGLDKKAAARVFDKFFQAEGLKKREGFGLGLAICKLIVESHGGSVSVESKPGKGCTFWMTLPYEG
jgi:signal transduction histidine kinase